MKSPFSCLLGQCCLNLFLQNIIISCIQLQSLTARGFTLTAYTGTDGFSRVNNAAFGAAKREAQAGVSFQDDASFIRTCFKGSFKRGRRNRRFMLLSSSLRESESLESVLVNELQGKTVKELKEIAKQYPDYTSKVKLKRDLIHFLAEKNASYGDNESNTLTSSSVETNNSPKERSGNVPKSIKKARLSPKMVPLISSNENEISQEGSPITQGIKTHKNKNKKDVLYDFVVKQYPPLAPQLEELGSKELTTKFDGVDMDDIRAQHHPLMVNLKRTSSDMEMVFVGTASCCPSATRGVSCTALRLNWRRNSGHGREKHEKFLKQTQQQSVTSPGNDVSPTKGGEKINGQGTAENTKNDDANQAKTGSFEAGTWLFDCGECTQLQLQRTSYVKPGKISKIFITHAHGDHTFGLPGVMCLMGQDRSRNEPPLEIYGPEGLRMYLRIAIRYSVSRIVPNYVVHELKSIPMAPEWRHASGWYRHSRGKYILGSTDYVEKTRKEEFYWGPRGLAGEDPSSWITLASSLNLEPDVNFGEVGVGRDIYPEFDHPDCVDGAPIWTVEDEGDVVVHAAPMSHGVPCVGYVVKERSKSGKLRPEFLKPIIDRNFEELQQVISNPMKVFALIKNMPEGSSYTFPDGTIVKQEEVVEKPKAGRKIVILGDTLDPRAIAGLADGADVVVHEATNSFLAGIDSGTSLNQVTSDAMRHGHSTPYMAGQFAKQINAKRLILNHFSSRYKGDQTLESMSIMTRIERQAIKSSGLPTDRVAAAWDFMILPVPYEEEEKSDLDNDTASD